MKFKVGDKVRIKDTSADCPSGTGTIAEDMCTATVDEYEVAYNDGIEDTFGLFYADELEDINELPR